MECKEELNIFFIKGHIFITSEMHLSLAMATVSSKAVVLLLLIARPLGLHYNH